MNIAIINIQSVHATATSIGPSYILEGRVAAWNGTSGLDFGLTITIPEGASRAHFNDAILQAGIDLLAAQGVTVDTRDVFFQAFERG